MAKKYVRKQNFDRGHTKEICLIIENISL